MCELNMSIVRLYFCTWQYYVWRYHIALAGHAAAGAAVQGFHFNLVLTNTRHGPGSTAGAGDAAQAGGGGGAHAPRVRAAHSYLDIVCL